MPPKTVESRTTAKNNAKAEAKREAAADAAHDTLNHWKRAMSGPAFLKKVEEDEDGIVANMPEDVVAEHVKEVTDALAREAKRNA